MIAMIFAAGLGTRLRPLTDTMPKALVPVGGKPALRRVIERIMATGITDIIVNVNHFSEKVIKYLADNDNFGANITISDESSRLLDTGGGLLKALPLIGNEPVLLHNADIATDVDLKAMIEAHLVSNADATLLTSSRKSSRQLLFDADHNMRGWKNLTTGQLLPEMLADDSQLTRGAFNGIHIVKPSLHAALREYAKKQGAAFSITPFYINICNQAKIAGYQQPTPYQWFDIGRPESLALANQFFEVKEF